MTSNSVDEKRPSSERDSLPEDAIPQLDARVEQQLQAEADAHLGVKKVEAAEKVYGKYSKWFLFLGCAPSPLLFSFLRVRARR